MMLTSETKVLLGVGIATLLIFVGGIWAVNRSNQKSTNPPVVDNSRLVRDTSHKIATDSATLTLVEFGDFQCPACAAAHPIVTQVLKDYATRMNFVFRNYPLPQHKNSVISAQAAEAAGVQGKYWEMYDKLYVGQADWSELGKPLDKFASYAQELGLDVNQFKADVTANKFTKVIQDDQADGDAAGVTATPTFYLNGQKVEGISSYADFKSQIDAALVK